MATLEELLCQALAGDPAVAGNLAKYNLAPAIFEKQAPSDSSPGWGGKNQYPRIQYAVMYQDDPERKVSGMATFDILTLLEGQEGPEDIETGVKGVLDGSFFETSNLGTIAVRWQRSDAYDQINERGSTVDDRVAGMDVICDLMAFPGQTVTTELNPKPDPIAGLIAWTKTLLRNNGAFFIEGAPQAQPIWKPTSAKPAIYWRFVRQSVHQALQAVVWWNVTCACHVIAPQPADRIPYIRKITEAVAMAGTVPLPDGSYMLLTGSVAADSNNDPLSVGQITITGRYGVIPVAEQAPPLNTIKFKFKKGGPSNGY